MAGAVFILLASAESKYSCGLAPIEKVLHPTPRIVHYELASVKCHAELSDEKHMSAEAKPSHITLLT